MKKFIALSIFCFSVILLASCDKRETPTPGPSTKIELLTSKSWKFSSAFVSGIDVSSQIQACQKDNILTFSMLKTGFVDEGSLKCNSSDPNQVAFVWDFNTAQTELIISGFTLFTGGSNTFTIVSLTFNTLSLSQTISLSGGSQTVTVNFIPN